MRQYVMALFMDNKAIFLKILVNWRFCFASFLLPMALG